MARFAVGQPIATKEPSVTVDGGLPVGLHGFQLEVMTADGRRSKPDVMFVEVVRTDTRDPLRPPE